MKGPRKLTPEETLKALELSAEADAAMREVLAMTPEEVDKDLEDAGFDMAAQRAKARARVEQLRALAGSPPAKAPAPAADPAPPPAPMLTPSPEPSPEAVSTTEDDEALAVPAPIPIYRRPRVQFLFAAAAVVLTLAGVGMALALRGDIPILRPENTWPKPREKTPEQRRAALLREEARAACELRDAVRCREKLEEAKGIDPGGEKAAAVVETRSLLDALPPSLEDDSKKKAPAP
jgi:hypothetical protein